MNYRYEQRFEFNGQLLTRSEIARMTGVSRSTLYNRMKQGHSVSEAVAMGMTKADEIAAEHRKEKDGYWCAMCEYQEDVDRCAFCEDKSEFRKDWKFLTEGEVSKIRNDQCRNCKHVATNGGDSKVGKKYIAGCSYLDDTGHCRKCDPRDCAELGFYERVERRGRRKARPGKF